MRIIVATILAIDYVPKAKPDITAWAGVYALAFAGLLGYINYRYFNIERLINGVLGPISALLVVGFLKTNAYLLLSPIEADSAAAAGC